MIIIKTEELNFLVYNYLLEQGLNHSAFSLASEIKLEQYASKYVDETKPGHLINLLEKALVFQQIQDHIHMNQCFECKVPTYLIPKHICQFTERKQLIQKQEKRERELVISNSLMRSQEFVSKDGQTIDQNIDYHDQLPFTEEITLMDWNPFKNLFAIYQQQNNCIKIIQRDGLITTSIMPAVISESPHKIKLMKFDKAGGNYLFIIFENGVVTISDSSCTLIKMFNIKNSQRMRDFQWNLNWPNLVTICFEKEVEIIDVFKGNTIKIFDNCYYFEWRFYDQFIALDCDFYINLYQIESERPTLSLKADVGTTQIEFNKSKTLLATFSSNLNIVKIWTLLTDKYVYEITHDKKILQFCWCSSQNANYLITLLSDEIIIWDVEFAQKKCSYQLEFDIQSMISLDLLVDSPQVAITSQDNRIMIYDLINKKRRILNVQQMPIKICRMNEDEYLHHQCQESRMKEEMRFILFNSEQNNNYNINFNRNPQVLQLMNTMQFLFFFYKIYNKTFYETSYILVHLIYDSTGFNSFYEPIIS